MYALLFNDQHQVVDSSRFRITNVTSPGWLSIPIDAKPGIYHFTAFTSLIKTSSHSMLSPRSESRCPSKPENEFEVRLNKDNLSSGDTLEADLKITDSNGKLSVSAIL